MKKPTTKLTEKQLTIISAAAGAVVFVVICLVIFTAVSTAGRLDADVRKLEATTVDLAMKERNLPRLEKEIESLQVEVAKSVQILPNEQEIADLIRNLSGIVNKTAQDGVTIKIRTFEPEQENNPPGMVADGNSDQRFTVHPYIVEAEGSYYHLGKFINLLENHIRFIKVDTYEMANPKDEKLWDRPARDVKMKIVTYTYNPSKGEKVIPREKVPLEFDDSSDKFSFETRNRRDPFRVPLAINNGPPSKPPIPKEKQMEIVTQAERLYSDLIACIENKKIDDAVKNFIELENLHKSNITGFTVPDCYSRMQQIYSDAKDRVKTIQGVMGKQAVARAESLLGDMNKAFQAGEYQTVEQMKEQMDKTLPAQLEDEELVKKATEYKTQASELVRRSEIRIEFFKADIWVTGTSRMAVRCTVMFNGKAYGEEGSEVTIGGVKFLVKSIDPDECKVKIVYKGEEIELRQGEEHKSSAPSQAPAQPKPKANDAGPASPAPGNAPAGSGTGAAPPETPGPSPVNG